MAGSFSGHLVDSFLSAHSPRGPFGQFSPQIATHGPLSFAPAMHGTFSQQSNTSSASDSIFMSLSEDTAKKIATLQAKLDKKLGPEFISQRPGPGGGMKLTYAEGWKIINLANEVFGYNGWSSSVVSLTTDFIDMNEETKRYTVGVTAIVRVMLRDGVFHEDIGYGMLENSKSKGAALDKCKKEAVTDGIKRALRNFGNLLGNCLYDKAYTQEVVKIKVQPPKFNQDDLYRRPEFDQTATSSNSSASTVITGRVKSEISTNVMQPPAQRPAPSVLPHMRTVSGPGAMTTPIKSEPVAGPSKLTTTATVKPPVAKNGLNTPLHTPQLNGSGGRAAKSVANPAPPLAAAPASEPSKNVSFAPSTAKAPQAAPAALNEDDSFMLNSEDDAFFAGIDLGDETVAPEDPDEGLGGPIDFDEGLCGIAAPIDNDPKRVPSPLQGHQRAQQHIPPQQRLSQNQQRPQHPPRRLQTTAPTINQPSNLSPHLETKHESTSQRAPPSMGGFNFPAGANPVVGRAGASFSTTASARVSTIATTAHASSSGIGLKRTADAMHAHSSTARRPMQGMGLAHHNNGVNGGSSSTLSSSTTSTGGGGSDWTTGRREPLTTIHADIPGGGDIKRLKR